MKKRKTAKMWAYAIKQPDWRLPRVMFYYTKREALHDRRYDVKVFVACGPVTKVEVPL